jgi:hypothetical protein
VIVPVSLLARQSPSIARALVTLNRMVSEELWEIFPQVEPKSPLSEPL